MRERRRSRFGFGFDPIGQPDAPVIAPSTTFLLISPRLPKPWRHGSPTPMPRKHAQSSQRRKAVTGRAAGRPRKDSSGCPIIQRQRPRWSNSNVGDSRSAAGPIEVGAGDSRHAISGQIARGLLAEALRALARRSKDANQSGGFCRGRGPGRHGPGLGGEDRRDGRRDAARLGPSLQWVGPEGLVDNWTEGPKPRLPAEVLAQSRRSSRRIRIVRRTGRALRRLDPKRVIAERFGVDFHPRYVGKLLKKLGFSHISARPRHPAQDERTVEAFKKTSRAR